MMFGGGILSSDYQLVLISLAILSLLSVGSCQNCRLINASEVDSILSQVHPPSDWVVQPLQLVDYNITCLAVSSLRDRYRYTSVSVTYLNKNEALTAMLDVGCSAETDQWDPLVLGDDETFVWTSGVVAGPARRDCASCMNTAASDNLTHCVGKIKSIPLSTSAVCCHPRPQLSIGRCRLSNGYSNHSRAYTYTTAVTDQSIYLL